MAPHHAFSRLFSAATVRRLHSSLPLTTRRLASCRQQWAQKKTENAAKPLSSEFLEGPARHKNRNTKNVSMHGFYAARANLRRFSDGHCEPCAPNSHLRRRARLRPCVSVARDLECNDSCIEAQEFSAQSHPISSSSSRSSKHKITQSESGK